MVFEANETEKVVEVDLLVTLASDSDAVGLGQSKHEVSIEPVTVGGMAPDQPFCIKSGCTAPTGHIQRVLTRHKAHL